MVKNLARNTTYITGALTFQKMLAFVYFWFISSRLVPDQLGQYIFALSFTSLLAIFIDLGLSQILTREAAKKDEYSNHLLRNVIGIKLPLAACAFIASWLIITFSGKPIEVRMLVYLASFVMVLDSFTLSFWVIFRAKHNLMYESIGTIMVQIIIFTIGLWALFTTGKVLHLILALVAASLFNFTFSTFLLKKKLHYSLKPAFDRETFRHIFKILPAFALAAIFVKIYNTADSVLLSFLTDDQAVGFYAIPAKVVTSLQQIIPVAFSSAFFPLFSYYYAHSREKLAESFIKAYRYLLIIAIPLASGLAMLSGKIILTIWPAYAPIISTFVLMALSIPFVFLAFPTGYMLNACDRQKNNTAIRGVVTLFAITLNIILIPWFSYFGAGMTYLLSNIILLILDFWWVKKIIAIDWKKLLKIFSQVGVATIIMLLMIMIFSSMNIFVIAILSIIVYFIALYALGGFKFSEFASILKKSEV